MESLHKNDKPNQIDNRKIAMDWWNKTENNLNDAHSKWKLGYKYFNRHWMSLTGREIEIIYKCENKLTHEN